MSALTILATQEPGSQTLRLALVGQIDEAADYSAVDTTGARRVVFDFEGIKLINSTGLQSWIRFLAALDPSLDVAFSRCSIRVISQINMFPGFMAGKKVEFESFFAPYFCGSCDASCDILLRTASHREELASSKAPPRSCPRCGGEAEFDGIERKYFLFLQP